MAALSVNTNFGAMIALQQLTKTNMELTETQSRINTGRKVSSARDNGAIYAIAQGMRADIASYGVVKQSLDRVISTTDVALAAGEAISDLLIEMREKTLAAKDTTLTTDQRAAYNQDFVALRDQIVKIVENAEFNGVNLIDGSQADGIKALANADGTNTITVATENFGLGTAGDPADPTTDVLGSIVALTSTEQIDTVEKAETVLTRMDTSLTQTSSALARLGTASKSLQIHATFIGKLSDQMIAGVGNLVDADLAEESARLQALQTRQQLGVQALAIANQAPNIINALFQ